MAENTQSNGVNFRGDPAFWSRDSWLVLEINDDTGLKKFGHCIRDDYNSLSLINNDSRSSDAGSFLQLIQQIDRSVDAVGIAIEICR